MYHIFSAFISCSISIIGVILFGKIVLDEKFKISKIKVLLLFIIANIIYTFVFLYLNDTLKTILMLLTDIIIYILFFKIYYKKSLLITILYIFLLVVSDTLNLFLYTKLFGIDKNLFYLNIAGGILGNLTVVILFIIVTYLIRKPLRKVINFKLENNIRLIILSTLIFISLIIFLYIFSFEYRNNHYYIQYLFVIGVLVIILGYLLKQSYDNMVLNQKYDKILGFMTTYEQEVEKQRILRHETKNEFLNIKGQLIDKEENKNIIEYIDSILNDASRIKYEEYAKFQYLPPNGIKGLCYLKVDEAQNKGIAISINISSRISKSNIYSLTIKERKDFARILGVYLDNAIEASMESKENKIGIEAYIKNGEFQMIISNTYNGELDNRIDREKFSTKGKNRGHGLLLVKNIIKMNEMFEVNTKIENGLYIQYITIKKSI